MIVRFTDTASARSKYHVVAYSPVVSSWEQARDQCRQLGMDLVKIENSQEDNALKNLLATECSKYARIYIIKDKEFFVEKVLWKQLFWTIFQFLLIYVREFDLKITFLQSDF